MNVQVGGVKVFKNWKFIQYEHNRLDNGFCMTSSYYHQLGAYPQTHTLSAVNNCTTLGHTAPSWRTTKMIGST